MENGQAIFDELKQERSGGMPWMTILDGNNKEIICSSGPDGNIGCPVAPKEIDYFLEMIKTGADASEEELATIREAMEANSKAIEGG